MKLSESFKEAVRDLFWLLNRGYPKKSSVDLVGNRYMLCSDERKILYRGVFEKAVCIKRRSKIIKPPDTNLTLLIDGLNILITIVSYLKGRMIFRALDGYVRDIAGVFGNFGFDEYTVRALELFIQWVKRFFSNAGVVVFLDYNASKSGELASYIRKKLDEIEVEGEVLVDKRCDGLLISRHLENGMETAVVTSDTGIIDRAVRTVDPFSDIFNIMLKKKIPDIRRIADIRFPGR